MNCIDPRPVPRPFFLRKLLSLAIIPVATFAPVAGLSLVTGFLLVAGLSLAPTSSAQAGPQFSIPGLNSLQRKFQKQRRRREQQQRESQKTENPSSRVDWENSPPPPPPYRNPRYVEMEKQLETLRIIEPDGLKRALKAERTMRAQAVAKSRAALLARQQERKKNLSRRSDASKPANLAPTRWSRPQSAPAPGERQRPATEYPAFENASPPQLSRQQIATEQKASVKILREQKAGEKIIPEQGRAEKIAPQQNSREERTPEILALALPPLPIKKPRRHPSQIVEEDWTATVIENAIAQCATLGIKLKPMPAVKKGLCGNPAPILMPLIGIANIRPAATLSCPMAANLNRWFTQSVQPLALKHFGKKVQQIRNISSYVCRNRYGDTTKRISEHAYANALDIAHFELQGGEKVSVLKDWSVDESATEPNAKSAFLHAVHKSACQYFGTVLGPNANAAHKDHFHLDNAPRKRSNYCR